MSPASASSRAPPARRATAGGAGSGGPGGLDALASPLGALGRRARDRPGDDRARRQGRPRRLGSGAAQGRRAAGDGRRALPGGDQDRRPGRPDRRGPAADRRRRQPDVGSAAPRDAGGSRLDRAGRHRRPARPRSPLAADLLPLVSPLVATSSAPVPMAPKVRRVHPGPAQAVAASPPTAEQVRALGDAAGLPCASTARRTSASASAARWSARRSTAPARSRRCCAATPRHARAFAARSPCRCRASSAIHTSSTCSRPSCCPSCSPPAPVCACGRRALHRARSSTASASCSNAPGASRTPTCWAATCSPRTWRPPPPRPRARAR